MIGLARNRYILLVTLGYAVLAALWIFFSDMLLGLIVDPQVAATLGTAKGIAFVMVTSGLLVLALRNAPKDFSPTLIEEKAWPWPQTLIVVALTAGIALVAGTIYRAQSTSLKDYAYVELQAVAKLKATGVAQWMDERRANVQELSGDPILLGALMRWRQSGDKDDERMLRDTLRRARTAYGFQNIVLLDSNGLQLIGDQRVLPAQTDLGVAIQSALRIGGIQFLDLSREKGGSAIHMAFLTPMSVGEGLHRRLLGMALFDMRPQDFLYPYLLSWPLPRTSGEVLLFRQEGDALVVLNELRHRSDTALNVRMPMSNSALPTVQYVTNHRHLIEGVDYRGVGVLAAAISVSGTPWTLIAKTDKDEALGWTRLLGLFLGTMTLLGLAAAAAFVGYLWQRQRLRAALSSIAEHRAEELADERFRDTFEKAAVGIGHLATDGRYLRANASLCRMLGYAREELLEKNLRDVVHADDLQRTLAKLEEALSGAIPDYTTEKRYRRKDGEMIWVQVTVSLAHGTPDRPAFFIVVATDISNRKRIEDSMRQAAIVFTSSREGVVITDAKGNIKTVNPAFCAITGYQEQELLGQNMRVLQSGRHDAAFYRELWATVARSGYWQGEIWNRRKNGELYPELLTISSVRGETGDIAAYVGSFADITGIKQSEAQLEKMAHHDPLTGLPNRLLLRSRLDHAILRSLRTGRRGAVLFLDLDRFKTVNDSLGHPAGDELLLAVAQRLTDRLRDTDTIARVGGDEFIIILEDITGPENVANVSQILIDHLSRPFTLKGEAEVYIGGSIGISLFPTDGKDSDSLIQQADSALYQAKEDGRGVYRFYTAALTEAANTRLMLEARLRRAVERDEFFMHYQPLVSISDRRILGVEALMRWQDPEKGLISPAQFIPLAEETGVIVALGEIALRTACRQMKAWLDAGLPLETVAVNLSPRQFRQPDLQDLVRGVLEETGLPARHLELEITEGAIMEQGLEAEAKLEWFRGLGIRIAIDDFGTGHSSLAYLKRFRINKLKVDQSFVRNIPADTADMEIAAAIIGLGKTLGLDVLAEGVETEAQLAFLEGKGCDSAQGYLFSRPVAAEEIPKLLNRRDSILGAA